MYGVVAEELRQSCGVKVEGKVVWFEKRWFGAMKFLVFVVVVCAAVSGGHAADSIRWLAKPREMSTLTPYVAHVSYTADADRQLVGIIEDAASVQVGYGSLDVVGPYSGPASIFLDFGNNIQAGNTYYITIQIRSGETVLAFRRDRFLALSDYVRLTTTYPTIPSRPFALPIVYTATVDRYIVVAIKNKTDTRYRGSARLTIPAGTDASAMVPLHYGGGFIEEGTELILRVDIRPLNGQAHTRIHRTEITTVVSDQTPSTPSPSPSPSPSPLVLPNTINFVPQPPLSMPSCGFLEGRVSYSTSTGPVRVFVIIKYPGISRVHWQQFRNLPPGTGEVTYRIPISNVVPGQVYGLLIDLRPESAPQYRNVLVRRYAGNLLAQPC